MCRSDKGYITIKLAVTILVDPTDDELLDRFDESRRLSIGKLIGDEIESNLNSVSYVRYVSVERIERR